MAAQGKSLTFSSGTRFGRYEIICPLGAGGMGEVYRARDTRLGRELAIKILSRDLAAGKEELQRFEREACSASALNHPNIITIFELGHVDGNYYIAMELVEGEPLRDMLGQGPLPLQKAIPIAAQIAEGLAKAHAAGVVHRDLKPENLMVSRDGFLKILDFGLAKLVRPDTSLGPGSTTMGAPSTTLPGTLLGTIEYMSPEQANGQQLDFRTDQFSFGAVLYEMVTGRCGFQRHSKAETLAAILRDHPEPVAALNARAPAPLCWVIERCLAKKPSERYESTRELARDLATIRDRLSEAPSPHSPPQLSTLPTQRTAFIGRDHEVAAIRELLQREQVRMVTLTGPGGIGKTRLGLQVANELVQSFPGGVCFVPLAAVNDPALVPNLVAQALGMRETGRQGSVNNLKEYLHDLSSKLLLFFDNFEHMLAATPAVADLMTMSSNIKVLVTSRAPLHIYGEHEFPVPSLALPNLQSTSLPQLSNNPAITLFLERATSVKPNFVLTEENALAVATICTRLDGLPLAIELAAARIKLLSPSAIQSRLESCLQLLTGGAKDLPLRQQTLRGTIDWSYDLLSPAEQALFRRVSVFVGGCTLEGVEAVCNTKEDLGVDVLEGMESLLDKSLVQQIEDRNGESRFVLLDTIRGYGLERLVSAGEEHATRRAHAAYCLVLAEEAAEPSQHDWVSLFEVDYNNFRSALQWLTRTGDADWGLRLATALFKYWDMREYLTEGRDHLEKILKLPAAAARSNKRARALFAAGVLAGEQGDYESARIYFEESLEIARELKDTRGIGIALNALAVNARDGGELAVSHALFEQSLAVWRNLGDRVVVARSLSNLANVVKLQGDYGLAHSLHQEAFAIFEELADSTAMAWSLNHQGDVAHEQGADGVARAFYERSLSMFRAAGDKWGIAGCLADLGNLARDDGDYAQAQTYYAESMKFSQELGQKRGIARLLDSLACSAVTQSKPERALRLAGAAAAMRRGLGAQLPSAEQARLEKTLDRARREVPPALAAAAWMDGWTAPVERMLLDALDENV